MDLPLGMKGRAVLAKREVETILAAPPMHNGTSGAISRRRQRCDRADSIESHAAKHAVYGKSVRTPPIRWIIVQFTVPIERHRWPQDSKHINDGLHPNAHLYETGGMRRTHLRGHANILKRLLVHVGGFNLGLLMRTVAGVGTPRGLQGRLAAIVVVIVSLWTRFGDRWHHRGSTAADAWPPFARNRHFELLAIDAPERAL